MKLKLSDALALPIETVTQTVAILAKRRAGKSYTMRRLVEQLLAAEQQVVVVDPKGDQWGLRSSADGKAPGYPVVIFGGEHGDVQLQASAGELIGKLVVEEQVSGVLDLSLFRKHELATFMTGFLETLYRLKAREQFRTRMMLVIDEADAVAPQKPQKGEERMLGAAEDIVRRGGQRGIGCVLVSQRSAVLNKNVLTQAQVLIALRTIAPQDLAAMNAWVDVHGTPDQKQTLMSSLPSLPVGDAWIWSPGWPTVDGIFARVHVLPITTFDSGATPDGTRPSQPKRLADVDLEAVRRQMGEILQKAKADDPRELRKRIADLEKQLKNQPALKPLAAAQTLSGKIREALTDADRALLLRLVEGQDAILTHLLRPIDTSVAVNAVARALEEWRDDSVLSQAQERDHFLDLFKGVRYERIREKLAAVPATGLLPQHQAQVVHPTRPVSVKPNVEGGPVRQVSRPATAHTGDAPKLGKLEGQILAVLVSAGPKRRDQLGVRCVARSDGGHFGNCLASLKTAGLVSVEGGVFRATETAAAVQPVTPLPADLVEAWCAKLSSLEVEIFRHIVAAYPAGLTRHRLGELTGKRSDGGHFGNCLSTLRGNGIMEGQGSGSEMRASEELFS